MSLAMLEAGIRPAQQTLKLMSYNRLLGWRTESRPAFLGLSGSAGLGPSAWRGCGGGCRASAPQQNSPTGPVLTDV